MYSPTLGRFMQTDPIGYGDGMNMYRYVGGDPVNGIDPSGMEEDEEDDKDCSKLICVDGVLPDDWWRDVDDDYDDYDYDYEQGAYEPDDESQPCKIAWTPDGDTKGDNPRSASGRYNTDLLGGFKAAIAVFTGLSRLDGSANDANGGFQINKNPLRPTTALISDAGNVALRWAFKDGNVVWRIDINAGTFGLKKAETIHFNGSGRGNMCPTS